MNNPAFSEAWEECYDGKILAMSPRPVINHNIVSGNIFHIFRSFLKGKACKAFDDGVEVHLDAGKDWVIPDATIVCNREIIRQNGIYGAPELVVEVLSPSTAKNDRGRKKMLYEKAGVREYWIVETAAQSVEVYLLKDGAFQLDEVYSVYPEAILEKMTDEEKRAVKTEFYTSVIPELAVRLADVFDGLI